MRVRTKTLEQVWHWLAPLDRVDILVVDVEGAEYEVIGTRPLPEPQPSYVLYESTGFESIDDGKRKLAKLHEMLKRQGYEQATAPRSSENELWRRAASGGR